RGLLSLGYAPRGGDRIVRAGGQRQGGGERDDAPHSPPGLFGSAIGCRCKGAFISTLGRSVHPFAAHLRDALAAAAPPGGGRTTAPGAKAEVRPVRHHLRGGEVRRSKRALDAPPTSPSFHPQPGRDTGKNLSEAHAWHEARRTPWRSAAGHLVGRGA